VLGFITKPWDERELLLVLERAVEAHQTLQQISRVAYQPERELRMFEDFLGSAPVPVTAQRFGVLPLRDGLPREFQRLAQAYGETLTLALERRVYKVDHNVGDALREIAHRLGSLSAGPRDVVDLHVEALRDRLAQASAEQRPAIADESRLLVLELMGHLTIVDVLERPQLAEDEKIMATPTVIRRLPLPVRRVIGDLSDPEKVISWLDLPWGNAATVAEDMV
jgi:hypothetical protein